MEKLAQEVSNCKDIHLATELLLKQIKLSSAVEKALDFCIKMHAGQKRKSGEDYAVHPILVATFVAYLSSDETMVLAALLHDVVEDTNCNIDEVRSNFGEGVANIVEGLTKIVEIREDQLIPSTSNEKVITSALSFRKMLLASIKDMKVLVIKLCDRLHNILTLDALREDKQKRIAQETLVVYSPIAHRLGISSIKNILEDYSFKYLMPKEYEKIDSYLRGHKQVLQLRLNNFANEVSETLLKNGFNKDDFKLEKRMKHYYSIHTKQQRKGVSIEEILDLLAIRIIVKEVNDCYKALGLLHTRFNPLIARFKDYIAIPKQNGYRTIHTTLFDNQSIVEAQIRTEEMHQTAEFGVAAHWMYKSGPMMDNANINLSWIQDIASTSNKDTKSDIELYEYAKDSLYREDIAVYSPKGDIFTLPRGATALDYAYEIHTEIGSCAKEARINNQKVPLLTELKSGDIVQIITSQKPILRCSWINSVTTAKAKDAINASCRQKIKDINFNIAKSLLVSTFNARDRKIMTWVENENLTNKIHKIATDSVYFQEIVNLLKKYPKSDKILFPLINVDRYKIKKQKFEHIVVYSNHKISNVEFDYCCHPKRGDDIVGFRKGTKVTVHHKFCQVAAELMSKKEEMAFVKWTRIAPNRYKVIVSIENKKGSLSSFLAYLAKMDINLVTISINSPEEAQIDYFEIVIEIPENKEIDKIKEKIKSKYKLINFLSASDAYY